MTHRMRTLHITLAALLIQRATLCALLIQRATLCALLTLGTLLMTFTPARAQQQNAFTPDGATGVNIAFDQGSTTKWYIELQRTGADFVRDGVRQKNPAAAHALIGQGLTILNWGFAHQAPDGSFPGTAGGSVGQMFHSAAIFVDAAAKATLQLKAYDALTYQDTITAYTQHLQAAADWMTRPDVAAAGQLYNARFTHRRYMLASALSQVAELVPDAAEADKLSSAAADYARDGLSLMLSNGSRAVLVHNPDWSVPPATLLTPEQANPPQVGGQYAKGVHVLSAWGVNPELAGYDVSYQMVGVQYAERYYAYCQDELLKAHLASMIRRACLWEMSRIDGSGVVLLIGSSRVGLEKNRAGATKAINPDSIQSVLLDGYKITGDVRLKDAAAHINKIQQ